MRTPLTGSDTVIDTMAANAALLDERYGRLCEILRDCGSVCIGYSGGVDSVFLAGTAVNVLGRENVLAVTGRSAAYPAVQRDMALECARLLDIPHIEIETDELADERYTANPSNRCYYCKSELWPKLVLVAAERGVRTVLDGSNADDAGDYRPGFAAAREHGVRSPMLEASLTKADVRALSRGMGLPTWDQPAAPCLSSRLPYGIAVTPARLRQVERAEHALRDLGFRELRVRHHDDCLRIELAPEELDRGLHVAAQIRESIAGTDDIGPRVLIDAEGYRRGALNEALVTLGASRQTVGAGVTPPHEPAGFHKDIAVIAGRDATVARLAAASLRAFGFRYVALDTAAFVRAEQTPR
jgi:uncharacterized protein